MGDLPKYGEIVSSQGWGAAWQASTRVWVVHAASLAMRVGLFSPRFTSSIKLQSFLRSRFWWAKWVQWLRFCKCLGAKLDFSRWVEETKTGKENNAGWDLAELTGHGLLRKKKPPEIKSERVFCLLVRLHRGLDSQQCLSGTKSTSTASTTAAEHGIKKLKDLFWGHLDCCPPFSKCTNTTRCFPRVFRLLFSEGKLQQLEGCCLETWWVSMPAGQSLGSLGDFD